jgi:hypothetical protein
MPSSFARLALLVCLGMTITPAARCDEFFYLLVFGSQTPRPCPRYSHTFATFVRATGRGPCAESYQLECNTISWLPEGGDVRLAALMPECGRNLDLDTTLHWATGTGQHIALWGPYQIDRELYGRALHQVALLESGAVCYKAIDTGYLSGHVSNCIHAVAAVADGHGRLLLSPGFGEVASYWVSLRFRPWLVEPRRRHDWVASRLGLDGWPIVRRD